MPVGYSAERPITLGAVADDESYTETPRRVRVLKPVGGLKLGQAAWVVGPAVSRHVESGALVDITRTAQRRRQWRVGAFTYSDFGEASRVAAAQGTKPVEIN